jgi:hypothetical protein
MTVDVPPVSTVPSKVGYARSFTPCQSWTANEMSKATIRITFPMGAFLLDVGPLGFTTSC